MPGSAGDGISHSLLASILDFVGARPTVGTLISAVFVATVLKATLFVLALRQVGYAAADVATSLRVDLLRALVRARWTYLVTRPAGSFINAVGTESMRVSQLFTETCLLFAMVIQVLVYVSAALIVSWQATVAGVVFGGVLLFALRGLVRMATRAGASETDLLTSLSSRLGSVLGVMKPVKAMAREAALQPLLESETRDLNVAYRRQVISRALHMALQEPIIAGVLGLGFFIAFYQGYEVAELLVMAFLFYRIITRIGNAQSHAQNAAVVGSAYEAITDTIAEARSVAEEHSGSVTPRFESGLALRGVSVSYDDRLVLRDLTFTVPTQTLTAIVGPSGAGKTSLVDLMVGLIEPSSGEILLDGIPLSQIDLVGWRSMIGYVTQDVVLLNDSIAMNVTLGQPGISDQAVEQALRASCSWDFVQRLPERLDSVVGERGLMLSGGQRQRLAIARAIVHRPKLLILDEATSALDKGTEEKILASLVRVEGLTLVTISHQSSMEKLADQVIVVGGVTP